MKWKHKRICYENHILFQLQRYCTESQHQLFGKVVWLSPSEVLFQVKLFTFFFFCDRIFLWEKGIFGCVSIGKFSVLPWRLASCLAASAAQQAAQAVMLLDLTYSWSETFEPPPARPECSKTLHCLFTEMNAQERGRWYFKTKCIAWEVLNEQSWYVLQITFGFQSQNAFEWRYIFLFRIP